LEREKAERSEQYAKTLASVKSEAVSATKKYDGIQKDLDDWIAKANTLEK